MSVKPHSGAMSRAYLLRAGAAEATASEDRARATALTKKLIVLCAAIVGVNLIVGLLAPTSAFLEDEVLLLDNFWRAAQGQHVGIDYHDPLGFGPALVGAALWHLLGVHYYVFHLTSTIFSFAIVLCGCIVAGRRRAGSDAFGWLFCLTLAFVMSTPTVLGFPATTLGMSEYFNRLILGALAVLFLQTFAAASNAQRGFDVVDVLIAAILLNLLFLIKISGPILGIGIVLAGCLMPGELTRRPARLGVVLLAFAALTVIEFAVSGLQIVPVFREYFLAGQARGHQSPFHLAQAFSDASTLGSIALLSLFVASRPSSDAGLSWWRGALVVLCFGVLQVGLFLTNSGTPPAVAAPAAAMALAGYEARRDRAKDKTTPTEGWWRRWHPARLATIPARDVIPLLMFGYVLFPQIKGTLAAAVVGVSVALGLQTPIVVTAGSGMAFRTLPFGSAHETANYAISLEDGVRALASLGLSHKLIATVDYSNPFPLLFRARSPKGVRTWWDPGFNVPVNVKPTASEVVGDACVAMVPAHPNYLGVAAFLERARKELPAEFNLVYQDEWWSIYRRRSGDGAVTAGGC